jgi:hypothetical protein
MIRVDVRPGHDLYVGPARIFRAAGLPRIRAPAGLAGEATWAQPKERQKFEQLGVRRMTALDLLLQHLGSAIEAHLPRLVSWEAVRQLVERHGLGRNGGPSAEEMSAVRERSGKRIPVLDFANIYGAAVTSHQDGRVGRGIQGLELEADRRISEQRKNTQQTSIRRHNRRLRHSRKRGPWSAIAGAARDDRPPGRDCGHKNGPNLKIQGSSPKKSQRWPCFGHGYPDADCGCERQTRLKLLAIGSVLTYLDTSPYVRAL